MLPSSQEVLIEPLPRPGEGTLLAAAFSDFIAASSRLELSYRDLQAEVAELTQALSERNQALSQSLSENEAMGEQLRRILEAIPCGVLVMGEDGSIRLANPEASRLLALSAHPTQPVARCEDLPPGLHLELQAPAPMEEEGEQEFFFDSEEGRVWVAVRRVHLAENNPTLPSKTEAVLTLRDVSVRKRMEEEREAARDAVALAQVSALLAHEIRNPLASLELFAGLLNEDPEHRDQWTSHLRAGIRSLSGTVNNVLTLHGNIPLMLEPVDVFTEVRLAVDFLQPMAQQAEVNLHLESEVWLRGTRARSNRSALHQILLNLCANALRHTATGGMVRVTCHAPAPGTAAPVRIDVVDNGCGIPADHLPQLFQVGFSGSGATSGLGLAVCDRLARQMGGSLAVNSRVGHGSTFTLEIPQA